jgi:hypothetical protein
LDWLAEKFCKELATLPLSIKYGVSNMPGSYVLLAGISLAL